MPDADDLAQGRTRARLPACRCTHVRNRGRTCVRSHERKGFAFRFEHDSSGRIFFFFKINLLSAVSVSSRHRLSRIAYARFPPRGCSRRTNTRILLCLARRHVCPVSDIFRQLCAKDKEKNEWEQRRGVLRFKNWWQFRFSLLRWWKICEAAYTSIDDTCFASLFWIVYNNNF